MEMFLVCSTHLILYYQQVPPGKCLKLLNKTQDLFRKGVWMYFINFQHVTCQNVIGCICTYHYGNYSFFTSYLWGTHQAYSVHFRRHKSASSENQSFLKGRVSEGGRENFPRMSYYQPSGSELDTMGFHYFKMNLFLLIASRSRITSHMVN